jgi:hypothetical protein
VQKFTERFGIGSQETRNRRLSSLALQQWRFADRQDGRGDGDLAYERSGLASLRLCVRILRVRESAKLRLEEGETADHAD